MPLEAWLAVSLVQVDAFVRAARLREFQLQRTIALGAICGFSRSPNTFMMELQNMEDAVRSGAPSTMGDALVDAALDVKLGKSVGTVTDAGLTAMGFGRE